MRACVRSCVCARMCDGCYVCANAFVKVHLRSIQEGYQSDSIATLIGVLHACVAHRLRRSSVSEMQMPAFVEAVIRLAHAQVTKLDSASLSPSLSTAVVPFMPRLTTLPPVPPSLSRSLWPSPSASLLTLCRSPFPSSGFSHRAHARTHIAEIRAGGCSRVGASSVLH